LRHRDDAEDVRLEYGSYLVEGHDEWPEERRTSREHS
jgi:hypothetical protein